MSILQEAFYGTWKALKSIFGQGSALDPAGEAHDIPQIPQSVGRENPSSFTTPLDAFGVLDLDAFGVLASAL